jgi:hypothetical protein
MPEKISGTPKIARTVGIADPYLKLAWAEHHLKLLDFEVSAFSEDKPYSLERYDDLKLQLHIMKVRLNDVPDRVCLVAGDVISCMRSSLDHLVWSLASGPGNVKNADYTQFPILDCLNSDTRKRFRRQTAGVPELALKEIKTFQPYHRGNAFKTHWLWRLNTLRNVNEHRRVPTNGQEVIFHGFPEHLGTVMKMETIDDYHVITVPLAYKAETQFNPAVTIKVNFGWGDPARDPDALSVNNKELWEIYHFIAETVLPRFIKLFP